MGSSFRLNFRHLWQSRLYSSINVIGLAIGIASVILAMLYWKDERAFDAFHTNNPNLYRVTTTLVEQKGDKLHKTGGTGQVQGPAFKAGVPEILDYTRVWGGSISGDVSGAGKALKLQQLFVDESFFSVFSFPLLRGDSRTALSMVGSAVITETTARKYFNSIDVIGKELRMDADPSARLLGKPLVITGIAKDPPPSSSIRFDLLLSFRFSQLSFSDDSWLNSYLGTYVVLQPDADLKTVAKKLDVLAATRAGSQIAENKKRYGFDPSVHYGLQRITDIHLNPLSNTVTAEESGISNGSRPIYSYMLLGIAFFIITMAAINFVNISIADSMKRAREVGIRKIVGGGRLRIIRLFMGESALLCIMAFVLSLFIVQASLPVFNTATDKQISLHDSFDRGLFLSLLALLLTITGFAGLYPAIVLSDFKPSEVLYNKQHLSGRRSGILGRSLVVAQFTLAICMLIATMVCQTQMDFVRTRDLGYDPNQVIVASIEGRGEPKQLTGRFKAALAADPSIGALSFSGDRAGLSDTRVNDRIIPASHTVIDENYLPVMGIGLKTGRNLSALVPIDKTGSVLVNEAYVKAAGLENPVGSVIKTDPYFDKEPKTIVGVVRDFHAGSLREVIRPMVFFMSDWYGGKILVKFSKEKQKQAMASLERAYRAILPDAVYEYDFLDELNARAYFQEARWLQIIRLGAILSIFICASGLFGLAHLATGRRVKEIGVRKVLGASTGQIVRLLALDFLKLVVLGFLIAVPLAWIAMDRWLQDFAYHISMGPGVFILAGLIAVTLAVLAVALQSIKAAIVNPVMSLRSE